MNTITCPSNNYYLKKYTTDYMYSKMIYNYNYNITNGYDILIIFYITGEKCFIHD